MLRKYAILTGILIALTLLFIATLYYPGGSQANQYSIGYDWKNNYLSNLFSPKAVNGLDNPARPRAVAGVLVLSAAIAFFFWQFSKKIPKKGAGNIVRYAGLFAAVCAFLAVTPYHDLMVTLSSTCALLSIFYITVFIFKTKKIFMKILSVVLLLVFYFCNFLYYTSTHLEWLPVVQKVLLLTFIIWMISLEHYTIAADFQPAKNVQPANAAHE